MSALRLPSPDSLRSTSATQRGRWRQAIWISFSSLFAGRNRSALAPAELETVRAQFARLEPLRSHLQEGAAEIERCFLAIGSSLQELPDASDELVRHSERLLALATGKERGTSAFQETLRLLEAPLQFITQAQALASRWVSELTHTSERITKMLACEGTLQRTMAPLRHIRTLFRIESASLSHEAQQMFVGLTEDIERLQDKVQQTFSERFVILKEAQRTLNQLHRQIETETERRGLRLRERQAGIDTVLRQLQQGLKENEERDAQLTIVSRLISQEVGRLVMTMQTQDIVNQKIAHILSALETLPQWLNSSADAAPEKSSKADNVDEFAGGDTPGTEPRSLPWNQSLRRCRESSRVQTAQLKAVQDDLASARSQIIGSVQNVREQLGLAACREEGRAQSVELSSVRRELRGITNEFNEAVHHLRDQAQAVDDNCVCLTDCSSVTAGVDGLVQVLLETLAEVRSILGDVVRSSEEWHRAIRPVGGLASNVSAVMRELSAQVHLIALNAQVQAAHLQGGASLEVLAASTAGVAAGTMDLSSNVATQLDTLTIELDEIVASFAAQATDGVAQVETMRQTSASQEAALHQLRDETLAELAATDASMKRILELAGSIAGQADFHSRIEAPASGLQNVLAEIEREVDALLVRKGNGQETEREGGAESSTAHMVQTYTMESERQVHEAALGRAGVATAVVTAAGMEPELFTDAPEPSPTEREKAPSGASTGATIAPSSPTNAGLGDNVELF